MSEPPLNLIIETPGADDCRATSRAPVRMRARLRDRTFFRFDVDILDLSCTGFRAETAFRLDPGDKVWLTIPGFAPLEATVAWHRAGRYGCAFGSPLHPAVFDHIVAKCQPWRPN